MPSPHRTMEVRIIEVTLVIAVRNALTAWLRGENTVACDHRNDIIRIRIRIRVACGHTLHINTQSHTLPRSPT